MRAIEDAAVDADLVCADAILEPPPVEEDAGDEEDGDPREQQQRDPPATRGGEVADRRIAADHLPHAAPEAGGEVERVEPFGDPDREIGGGHAKSVRTCSRMTSRISAARSGARPSNGDDAVVRARGVDDEAGGAEQFVERAAGHVEMLDADEGDERVGVDHPAAYAVEHAVGQAVAEAAILALRNEEERGYDKNRDDDRGDGVEDGPAQQGLVGDEGADRQHQARAPAIRARRTLR